jgi:hypothetical protein
LRLGWVLAFDFSGFVTPPLAPALRSALVAGRVGSTMEPEASTRRSASSSWPR